MADIIDESINTISTSLTANNKLIEGGSRGKSRRSTKFKRSKPKTRKAVGGSKHALKSHRKRAKHTGRAKHMRALRTKRRH